MIAAVYARTRSGMIRRHSLVVPQEEAAVVKLKACPGAARRAEDFELTTVDITVAGDTGFFSRAAPRPNCGEDLVGQAAIGELLPDEETEALGVHGGPRG
jgi:hypothetical protein